MDEQIKAKVEKFFQNGKTLQYKKGAMILRAQEEPLGVMHLSKGLVKVYSISKKGEEVVVTIFKPGTFFPMFWALNNAPSNFFFEALTDVELCRCSRDLVVTFVKDNPDILLNLLKRTYSSLEGVLERMSYVMGEDAYERLLSELVISTKRFGEKGKDDTYLLHFSEKDLAAQTGLTRETISREMKKLKVMGFVTINKDQTITVNLPGLQSEL